MLDESVAFDMLAILMVKTLNGLPAGDEYQSLDTQIRTQLGTDAVWEILDSPEYHDLLSANRLVFECVGKAKTDQITAKEVDAANHRRYLAKKALQTKFWPKSPLRELKTER